MDTTKESKMRFKRTAPTEHFADHREDRFELELRPGHTVTRVDHTSVMGAGRKGRAAMVDMHRELTCTCGGHLDFGGLSVTEDLAHLRHFESPEDRSRIEAEDAEKRAAILKSLGVTE